MGATSNSKTRGKKTGGRPKGAKNKKTMLNAEEIALKLNYNPLELLAHMAVTGTLPTKEPPILKHIKGLNRNILKRTHKHPTAEEWGCLFTLCCKLMDFEVVEMNHRVRAMTETSQYIHPKKQAIQHIGGGEGMGGVLVVPGLIAPLDWEALGEYPSR